MNEPFENLANAVVIQAVKDYSRVIRLLRKHPKHNNALEHLRDLEEFFSSDWYKTLTDLDPEMLMSRVREVLN